MVSPDLLAAREPSLDIKTEPASPLAAATGEELQYTAPEAEPIIPDTKQKGPTACGVCEAAAWRYKCSRCYLPYCSVACNKAHQENHPPDPKPEPVPEPPSERPAKPTGPANPFQALDNSETLAWLFRKYPNLPQQLLDIHSATQPPPEDPSKQIPASLMQGISSRSNWSQEKGISRGKAALRRARQLPGEAGEAVREYCTLISLLLSEEEAKDSSRAMLQQQFAQQDADMIRQLMEAETSRR
ncbi:HIT zinc finger domain-containing protein [Hirsutella rhossiliensis]|uniref:HIT zinc finger domain-containing protein n=1 Tax=Hirsutella rhossiliensis TaxID=111463 RepID=A0A9P8SLG9_9HYPO|nr:HIT zinc finger domain-containing protein [Hirsutella rhossiliensis]KAH0966946.1 HIT zinc finger domain-containing protein [Hirsutella rhossiliensis]